MKIKEIKIINQDQSTKVADIGANAENVDYGTTNVKLKLDELSNSTDTNKANISKETNIRTTEVGNLQNQINSLASGSPKGSYATIAALVSANPDTGVYIITADGHIYSWTKNGNNAIDLGIYLSATVDKGFLNEDTIASAGLVKEAFSSSFDASKIISLINYTNGGFNITCTTHAFEFYKTTYISSFSVRNKNNKDTDYTIKIFMDGWENTNLIFSQTDITTAENLNENIITYNCNWLALPGHTYYIVEYGNYRYYYGGKYTDENTMNIDNIFKNTMNYLGLWHERQPSLILPIVEMHLTYDDDNDEINMLKSEIELINKKSFYNLNTITKQDWRLWNSRVGNLLSYTIDEETSNIIIHKISTEAGTDANQGYNILIDKNSLTNNFITIDVDATAIPGTESNTAVWHMSVGGYHTSTGGQWWSNNNAAWKDTNLKPKNYKFTYDLNYEAVYNDLDLSKNIFIFLWTSGNSSSDLIISKFNISWGQDNTQLDINETLYNNIASLDNKEQIVEKQLINLTNTVDDFISKSTGNIEIYDENGFPSIIQSYNGTLITVPKIPNNVLFIGNSLLQGFGTFGMAATNSHEDYYYYIKEYLSEKNDNLITEKLSGGAYESTTTQSQSDDWLNNTLLSKLNNQRQLVLIQLSDNTNTDEKRENMSSYAAEALVKYIRNHAPYARIAWISAWYSNTINQTAIKLACQKYGAVFIDISDLPKIEGNKNAVGNIWIDDNGVEHEITSTGVASHPSSQGMRQIADRVIAKLFA